MVLLNDCRAHVLLQLGKSTTGWPTYAVNVCTIGKIR